MMPDSRPGPAPWRSIAAKLALLFVVFVAVPTALYLQFRQADADKNALLMRGVQEEGLLVAEGLRPLLETFGGRTAQRLADALARISRSRVNVKVLFRPRAAGAGERFFYVASAPAVGTEYLESEREELERTGVLDKLGPACAVDAPLAVRYTNPKGQEEVLTSLTPINIDSGCWVVITSHATTDFVGSTLGRPYWQAPEVRIAAIIYLVMAGVVISLFAGVWRALYRFAGLAREIHTAPDRAGTFAARNRVPELAGVAEEFDTLVGALKSSARAVREAAEENAHALKAPIAVIAMAVEPLRKHAGADPAAGRAIEMIDRSIDHLDALISAARRMDEAAADLIDPPRRRIDLSRLLAGMAEDYGTAMAERGLVLEARIAPGIAVLGGAEQIETVVENLIDNAAGVSPPGGRIFLILEAAAEGKVTFTVEDEGPGVPAGDLGRIFERYVSLRPASRDSVGGSTHFGIGLWIVRRNVEAMGGAVAAVNRAQGGLRVAVDLPRTS